LTGCGRGFGDNGPTFATLAVKSLTSPKGRRAFDLQAYIRLSSSKIISWRRRPAAILYDSEHLGFGGFLLRRKCFGAFACCLKGAFKHLQLFLRSIAKHFAYVS
jgi:hypothetical protein